MPPVNNQPTAPMPPTGQPMAQFDPTQPIKKPKKHLNILVIPLIITIVFLLSAIGFGVWAYLGREDYKNNSDAKSAQAVAAAEKVQAEQLEADFVEREKEPLKQYKGPATYGSIDMLYPKTWSAFVTISDQKSIPVDGYMHPDVVPGLESGTAFALHFQVINTAYADELKDYESDAKSGKVKITAVIAPKVPNVAGVRIEGEVERGKQGSLVMFPVRDKTFKFINESDQYAQDFNEIILPNLIFVP